MAILGNLIFGMAYEKWAGDFLARVTQLPIGLRVLRIVGREVGLRVVIKMPALLSHQN